MINKHLHIQRGARYWCVACGFDSFGISLWIWRWIIYWTWRI